MGPRLLLVPETFPPDPGGVAVSSARLVRLLEPLASGVTVFTTTRSLPEGVVHEEPWEGTLVVRVGVGKDEGRSLLAAVESLTALVLRDGIDLLHAVSLAHASAWVAVTAARRTGRPSVVGVRGNDLDRDVLDPRRSALRIEALRGASAVTAVSSELAARARALVPRTGVAYVPNSVDGAFFRPGPPDGALRRRCGASADEALVGFAGEARTKKGIPELLGAFLRLAAERPLRLALAGGARDDARADLDLFRSAHPGAGERVVLLPYLDREGIRAFYRSCDVVVHPARSEGMPNAVLEALACGRPLAARAVGGVRDLARATRKVPFIELPSGDLGQPDPEGLAGVLRFVLDTPRSERERAARRGRVAVLRSHGAEVERGGYAAVYESLGPW